MEREISLELYNITDKETETIGKIDIYPDSIEENSEIYCNVEITNSENNDTSLGAIGEIQLKLLFVKSYYSYYSQLALQKEKEKAETTDSINNIRQMLEDMDSIIE